MENINIETIHNVQINYKLAGVGPRLIASIIDSIVKILLFIGLAYLFLNNKPFFFLGANIIVMVSIMLIVFSYDLLMEVFFKGQTIGKMAMKIKVVKTDGSSPEISSYLLRWLLSIVDIYSTMGGLAIVSIILSKNGQRIGDLAANTTVVKTKVENDFESIFNTYHLEHQLVYSEVDKLIDEDIYLASDLIKAYNESEGSEKMYNAVLTASEKFQKKMDIKSELPPLIFLKTIIKDYHNRN